MSGLPGDEFATAGPLRLPVRAPIATDLSRQNVRSAKHLRVRRLSRCRLYGSARVAIALRPTTPSSCRTRSVESCTTCITQCGHRGAGEKTTSSTRSARRRRPSLRSA